MVRTSWWSHLHHSQSLLLPRRVSGDTERPAPGRRSAWIGEWGLGGGAGHRVQPKPCPTDLQGCSWTGH
jgi:hypothetical protein